MQFDTPSPDGKNAPAAPLPGTLLPDPLKRKKRRFLIGVLIFLLLIVGAVIASYELIASPFQAMLLAAYGKRLTFRTEAGENTALRVPKVGPYNIRNGYTELPEFIRRLKEQGFEVTAQARISPDMARILDHGLYLPYKEKSVTGLSLLDCSGKPIYEARFPRYAYPDFNAIPPVIANTLLFIENRELLDPNHPLRNPAVEWDRLAEAVMEKAIKTVDPSRNVPGGSTLATQIEKYRHSPEGLTMTATDKLTQMASASLRAYLNGADTRASRRRIVLDYLNTVPLAATPGFGEVNGIGEGLEGWFGIDFAKANDLLMHPRNTAEAARAYKHVLGLLISQRKPSYHLLSGRKSLNAYTNTYLRLLAGAHVITPDFRDLALREKIAFRSNGSKKPANGGFAENKAASSLRVDLAGRLGIGRLYDLDRLDLKANATLHAATQKSVSDFLRRLTDPVVVEAAGLYGHYLLAPGNDLTKPIYSFTLYENTDDGALLRVQADNLDQPFDINKSAKLDMGSSAKLRTLITYLQLIAELRGQYAGLSRAELLELKISDKDPLMSWVRDYLLGHEDKSLTPMLEAAMSRTYSASPAEAFYTGGGVHRFHNFHSPDNYRTMDLWEATRNSVNLPFIRLMRDLVRHFMYLDPNGAARILSDPDDPRREHYLQHFADREGQSYLARFIKKYKGLKPEEATATLLNHLTANPKRLAAVYRYLEPNADIGAFTAFLKTRLNNPSSLEESDYEYLYQTYGPDKFDLSDRGYITQIHPLELWLVAYLRRHPAAGWREIVKASRQERIDVYDWLIKTSHKNAQDIRIYSLLEIEAFQEIHRRWRLLGYPFSSLVPSFATAIGSSADRPAALAELMGVIADDGVKLPPISLTRLEFGEGTPYHTVLKRRRPEPQRIFPTEIAQVVKTALAAVVDQGTARRLRGAFALGDGTFLPIGGKTGTGDDRFEIYSARGQVLQTKVMNRTATFAFYLGTRFFGVMTVFVPGEAAANYTFTSAIAVQIVKDMEPALRGLVLGSAKPEPDWPELVAAFDSEAETPVGGMPRVEPLPPPGTPAAEPAKPDVDKTARAQAARAKPATRSTPKTAHRAAPKPAREQTEPPPAPPPPQIDKPDPAPPPHAPPPPATKPKKSGWTWQEGDNPLF
jgi:membrane peptidoglycan carboxypeptidase